jgi:cobalt-zinc-cadmium efflux system protein
MAHHHQNHPAPLSFNAAFGIAVVLNLGFTVCQALFAFLSHSMSLMADAAHNFGDVFGLILAWGANWLMTLPARKRYSYGYKKISILAALTNALVLVAASTLMIYQSIHKLFHLTPINAITVTVVAAVGIFINGGTALLFMKGARDDLNIKGAFLHLLGDAVISIGVVMTGLMIWATGWLWLDPVIGLLIVVIILWGTWGLLRDSVRLILDAVPRHIDQHGIQEFLRQLPGVRAVHDLHIWGLSTREIALTAHLVSPGKIFSDDDYETVNKALKTKFKIDHATLQIETGNGDSPCRRSEIC